MAKQTEKTKKEFKNIQEVLVYLQANLNAPKNLRNSFGNYNYRSAESILEALKPLLKETEAVLTLSDDIEYIGDRYYIKATAKLEWGADSRSVTAYAREEESKKGMDTSQITGSTSSYSRKYALNGLFLIDDTKDADTDEFINQNRGQDKTVVKADKTLPWLNKSDTENYSKVVEALKGGFTMADVRKKWSVSKATEKELLASIK